MRTRLLAVSVFLAVLVLGLSSVGCVQRASVADPLRNVTITSPYPRDYPDAPTDKISVQYAVIAVARQVGIAYDWDPSFKNTDPVCRQWITPQIVRMPFPQAMEMILRPVGLTYTIINGKIVLGRRL
jgi:hypothetical protein